MLGGIYIKSMIFSNFLLIFVQPKNTNDKKLSKKIELKYHFL